MFKSVSLRRRACALALFGLASLAAPAEAGSSSGTIGVSLNVTAACVVNGASSVASSFGNGGTIAFATQPGLFGDVDAQLVTNGGGPLSVLCSPGIAPSLTIGSGAHDASGLHYLSTGTSSVAYHLFSDAARSSEITIGQALPLGTATSSAINVPLYARVNSGGVVLPAGAYTDTVQVTLAW